MTHNEGMKLSALANLKKVRVPLLLLKFIKVFSVLIIDEGIKVSSS